MADEGLNDVGCCGGRIAEATTITIHRAVGCEKQDLSGGQYVLMFLGSGVRQHVDKH